MRTSVQWCVVATVAVAFGALLMTQQRRVERLRSELGGLRAKQEVARRSIAETNRIEQSRAAAAEQPSDQAHQVIQLRADLVALNAKFAEMKLAQRQKPQPAEVRSWAATEWRNVGRGTPQAAVETALWAAAAGELDVLAQTLVLDDRARAAAEQLLKNLPAEMRTDYGEAERLIALLAAKDVPASTVAADVSELPSDAAGEARWRVKLQDVSGATRTARLTLRSAAGGWNVIVSDRDVARFAANLKR